MGITKNFQKAKGNFKVTFSLPTNPNIKSVLLLGDFNNWDSKKSPKFKSTKSDWNASVELPAGNRFEFKYLINGNIWENDQNADAYQPSSFGGSDNSVVILDSIHAINASATPVAKSATKSAATKSSATTKVTKAPAKKVAAPKVQSTKESAKPVATAAKDAAKPATTTAKAAPKASVAKATTKPAAAKVTAKAATPKAPAKAAAPKAPAKPATPKATTKKA